MAYIIDIDRFVVFKTANPEHARTVIIRAGLELAFLIVETAADLADQCSRDELCTLISAPKGKETIVHPNLDENDLAEILWGKFEETPRPRRFTERALQ